MNTKHCCCTAAYCVISSSIILKNMKLLTLWCCDVGVVQRVNDAGVIFTERQVFYQMGHVYLQDDRQIRS